jgi:galactokinase/mevalonate kinase-like predicted kinase
MSSKKVELQEKPSRKKHVVFKVGDKLVAKDFRGYNDDEIAKSKIANFNQKISDLKSISNLVDEGIKVLTTNCPIEKFGELLDVSWKIKRNLSEKVTNANLDKIYTDAVSAGAIGGHAGSSMRTHHTLGGLTFGTRNEAGWIPEGN